MVAALEEAQRIEMLKRAALGGLRVVEHGARGNRGGCVPGEAETIERAGTELAFEQRQCVIRCEHPVFESSFRANAFEGGKCCFFAAQACIEQGIGGGQEDLARVQSRELVYSQSQCVGAGPLRGAKLSGREIEKCQGRDRNRAFRCGVPSEVQGGEEVVFAGVERAVRDGARAEDTRDLAAHDLPGLLRIFHLLADGDAVAGAQQARDVCFGGVVRDAAHRHGTFAIARGEGDAEFAGGGLCVVEKQLVKVAQPEEKQCIGILLLGCGVLPHERSLRLGRRNGRLDGGVTHGLVQDSAGFRRTAQSPQHIPEPSSAQRKHYRTVAFLSCRAQKAKAARGGLRFTLRGSELVFRFGVGSVLLYHLVVDPE